jgi:hypothetical protein
LKLLRVVVACAMAALIVGCAPARPVVTVPPSQTSATAILEREKYEPTGGVAPPAIAYVDSEGSVVIRDPWNSPDTVEVGTAAPWGPPKWGYDPDYDLQGEPVALHKLVFVAPDSTVMQYDVSTGQVQTLPLDTNSATQIRAGYTPSGEFVVIDSFTEKPPRLMIFRPQTEERLWGVTYATTWAWSPSSEWVAIDVARRAGLVETSDLAVFSCAGNSIRVLVRGDGRHAWRPAGWASSGLLAYENAFEAGDPLQWVDAQTGTAPGDTPLLGLQWDRDRMARLIPENLWETWTGQYVIDGGEEFAAIVCKEPDGSQMVYVTSLRDGRWFRLASGDRPAWVQYPRRDWSN